MSGPADERPGTRASRKRGRRVMLFIVLLWAAMLVALTVLLIKFGGGGVPYQTPPAP